jgi:hypothetical protein
LLQGQSKYRTYEAQASGLIDAEYLMGVADSFNIPHEVIFVIAWNETRHGNIAYKFPRGAGIIKADTIFHNGEMIITIKHQCKEIGRMQLSPCVNWEKLLHDPICSITNLLNKNLEFAYMVNIHCDAENLVRLHETHDWVETIRHQNGDGIKSEKYLKNSYEYLAKYHLKIAEVVNVE